MDRLVTRSDRIRRYSTSARSSTGRAMHSRWLDFGGAIQLGGSNLGGQTKNFEVQNISCGWFLVGAQWEAGASGLQLPFALRQPELLRCEFYLWYRVCRLGLLILLG